MEFFAFAISVCLSYPVYTGQDMLYGVVNKALHALRHRFNVSRGCQILELAQNLEVSPRAILQWPPSI
jgi:hypothetical protein